MPSTAAKEKKTPTYTTVGSIYNPQAATPLHPPARRGRTFRYPPPYQSPTGTGIGTGLGLPKSQSALALQETLATDFPVGGNSIQKYSPLQQNYDRAVSPMPDHDMVATPLGLGIEIPGMREGNALRPPPGFTTAGKLTDTNSEDNNDVDEGNTLTTLFNVKGLTNLASYPNPMQKRAQKALAKGRNSNLTRPDTPSSFAHTSSDIGKEHFMGGSFSILSTGPGAPRPLTAGPPGQRQYRASTFEATLKALHSNNQTGQFGSQVESAEYQSSSASSFYIPHSATQPTASRGRPTTGQQFTLAGDSSALEEHLSISELESEPFDEIKVSRCKIIETLTPDAARKYFPNGLPPDYYGRYKFLPPDWLEAYPLHRQNSRPWTAEQLARRQTKIDQSFYAGTDRLGKSMEEAFQELRRRRFEATMGVIGEQRVPARRLLLQAAGKDEKVTYPPMTVEEANGQDDAAHIEPFLSMTFATFLSYAEEYDKDEKDRGWRSGFVTPDERLIDDTDEGNKSFFTEYKKPKKNRRARRGY
ncbi:hypothetical protein QBC33DRAFT_448424 [Phialemonium atrogriseum]|uniref:Uncharacterized protein n=1 Tax=Phialemonium atrogriseum TaxID=1093897 RepID=A0AAJ0FN33_9PEZI|nr:uncharacterized protein QBC33DRAFT_448424 [Phialemonium atrogriseum]KAK1768883.1 hypothetical protein QBC33DRAFT_448424 [Phialemonium atrogriseum]